MREEKWVAKEKNTRHIRFTEVKQHYAKGEGPFGALSAAASESGMPRG
jgi:hypothetical protein